MPRIRSLKPRFWDSPDTARADLACRLLFMAMWNWADDSGRGTANLKELEAFAFPNDEVAELPRKFRRSWRNFAEIFLETAEVYGVTLYEVSGRRYYEISSFRLHQSKDFRTDSSLPGPEEGEIWDLASEYGVGTSPNALTPAENPQPPAENPRLAAELYPLDRDRDRDRDRDKQTCATDVARPAAPPHFEEFWAAYPRRRDRRKAEKAFAAALKRADPDTIIDGARRYAQDPNRVEQFTKYPEGWLNGDSWLDEPLPTRNTPSMNGIGNPTRKALTYRNAAEQLIAELETGQ